MVTRHISGAQNRISFERAVLLIRRYFPTYSFSHAKRKFCDRSIGEWEKTISSLDKYRRSSPNLPTKEKKAICLAKVLIMCILDRVYQKFFTIPRSRTDLTHEYYAWKLHYLAHATLDIVLSSSSSFNAVNNAKELKELIDYLSYFTVGNESFAIVSRRRENEAYAINRLQAHYPSVKLTAGILTSRFGYRNPAKNENKNMDNLLSTCSNALPGIKIPQTPHKKPPRRR